MKLESALLFGVAKWERTHVRGRNAPDTAVPPAHHDLAQIVRSSIERRFTTGKVSTGFGYDDHPSLLRQSRSACELVRFIGWSRAYSNVPSVWASIPGMTTMTHQLIISSTNGGLHFWPVLTSTNQADQQRPERG